MAIYSASALATNSNIGSGIQGAEIRMPDDGCGAVLLEIGLTHTGASGQGPILLYRSLVPVSDHGNPIDPVAFAPEEWSGLKDGAASLSRVLLITQWTVKSDKSSAGGGAFYRRSSRENSQGNGAIWTFPRGLRLPLGSRTFVRSESGTTTALNVWAVIDA